MSSGRRRGLSPRYPERSGGGVDAIDRDEPVVAVGAVPLHLRSQLDPHAGRFVELRRITLGTVTFQREGHIPTYHPQGIVVL